MLPVGIVFLLLLSNCDSIGLGDKSEEPGGARPPSFILPVYFGEPAWHPGGTWIAAGHSDSLDTDGDGQQETEFSGIWLVHAETGRTQPLIAGFSAPAWSPNGRRLAMHGGGDIFTVEVVSLDLARIDTTSLRQLTTEGSNFYPAWSPDGEWIAYDSNANDPDGIYRVWKMRSDGSAKTNISDFYGRQADWSPDGRHILEEVFVDSSHPELVVVDTAGGDVRRLTFDTFSDQTGQFSPDGTRIAFQSEGPDPDGVGSFAAIFVINTDGTERKQVSPRFSFHPAWSPDGQQLVFQRWGVTERNDFPGSGHLWVIHTDGTGLRQLTR